VTASWPAEHGGGPDALVVVELVGWVVAGTVVEVVVGAVVGGGTDTVVVGREPDAVLEQAASRRPRSRVPTVPRSPPCVRPGAPSAAARPRRIDDLLAPDRPHTGARAASPDDPTDAARIP